MSGLAWRWEIPEHMRGKFSINLLEFLAAAITIEMTLQTADKPHKILSLTDNTSALGWMYKASFSEAKPVHDKIARWLAEKLMNRESALYSQHFKGKHNTIADSLSRDQHLSDTQLTDIFKFLLPQQTPTNFKIYPIPTEITSWICSLSRSLTKTQAWPQQQIKSKLGVLINGEDSCQTMESKMNGLRNIINNKERTSSPLLLELAEEISTVKQIKITCEERQSKPPSQMFDRPSGLIYNQTQP